jgi:NAD(P)-dependent dehydrogenase (short-subunit alcohol dehydrogenase family)
VTRTYVVTGSASGIGAATRRRLVERGARVIGVDVRDADVIAELGTTAGRDEMVRGVREAAGGSLNAVITCAGVRWDMDGLPGADPKTVLSVNYFGAVVPLLELRPLLAVGKQPRAAIVSSVAALRIESQPAVDACLALDEEAARSACPEAGESAYAASKAALALFVRRAAPTREWAGAGIALNAVGPGMIDTPMMHPVRAHPVHRRMLQPTPMGGIGSAEQVASLLDWLTSADNGYVTGQMIFIDGGREAMLRPDRI